MSRVLITGGTGAIGAALSRALLRDPAYEVRVSDDRPAPQWMRESCELRDGELRAPGQAHAAIEGCSHVVHLASAEQANLELGGLPFTTIEHDLSTTLAVIRAALDLELERFVFVSSGRVFERAQSFPTAEENLAQCPSPTSPGGSAALAGERACRAAYAEQGFRFAICRPFDVYGAAAADGGDELEAATELDGLLGQLAARAHAPRGRTQISAHGEQTRTPTHIDDVAAGLLLALGSPKAVGEDFNLGGPQELTIGEILQIAWNACDRRPDALTLTAPRDSQQAPQRSAPALAKARQVLGWQAAVEPQDGIAASARRRLTASQTAAATRSGRS